MGPRRSRSPSPRAPSQIEDHLHDGPRHRQAPADFVRKTGIDPVRRQEAHPDGRRHHGQRRDRRADETFFLELTGAPGADHRRRRRRSGTILDNDAPPTVQVPTTVSVPEGQTGDTAVATIDVTLSAPSGLEVSVDWATADGTGAMAGQRLRGRSGNRWTCPWRDRQGGVDRGDRRRGDRRRRDVQRDDLSAPVNAKPWQRDRCRHDRRQRSDPDGRPRSSTLPMASKREGASGHERP